MNMTNREESSAAEHETFPGPGPLKTDEAKRGIRPVEQMMDAAIERIAAERIARETQKRAAKAGSAAAGSPAAASAGAMAEPGHALTLARSDAAELMAMHDASLDSSVGSQLALATEQRGRGRLRWKGLDVSDEFRSYAERVARGEDLPPFAGKILAEPDPAFPWDPSAQKRVARQALKKQIGLWTGVAAFLGLSVAVLIVQVREQTDTWQAPESPLATVSLANQPSAEAAPSSVSSVSGPGLAPAAAENAPAAFSESGHELASPASAAAAAVNDATLVAPGAPTASAAPNTKSQAAGAPAPRPAVVKSTPPAAPSSAGVYVATRASATEAGSGTAASAPSASEQAVKAIGTGGTPAGSSVTAATDVAGASDSASALRADPKKEPTREASGMGSLLVESPSF